LSSGAPGPGRPHASIRVSEKASMMVVIVLLAIALEH